MKKPIVMLLLCRRIIADSLIKAIEQKREIEAFGIYNYKNAAVTAMSRRPDIVLVEIPERHGNPAKETLEICEGIKQASPGCKVVLLCPEQDEDSVNACIDAKRSGNISDYLFYDSGVDYLVSKLKALCPA